MGGVNGMLAEMDRDATVARLAAGKKIAKAQGKHVDGRYAFGQHPAREYDWERAVVARIGQMRADGRSFYSIAKELEANGVRSRYGTVFSIKVLQDVAARLKAQA